MMNINLWKIAFILLSLSALVTIVPILLAFLKKVKIQRAPKWFSDASVFGNQQQRLIDHELRMEGTMVYWKNKAAAHQRMHNARVIWSLLSAVTLPVLVQFFDKQDLWSVAFLTGLTTWTGFIVALAHAMKSEQMYQGFRQCESDYYDLARELLDWPAQNPQDQEKQVNEFLKEVESVRKVGRKVETGSPPSGRKGF
jgi:hypothetical protein